MPGRPGSTPAGLGTGVCGEPAECGWPVKPRERARAAELGIASELREGVPEREEGPLKAEGTGLLLPLLAPCPRCCAITPRCCSLARKVVPAC